MEPDNILTLGILVACLTVASGNNQPNSALMLSSPSQLDDNQSWPYRFDSSSPRYAGSDTIAQLTFDDYPCTPDCTEHESGYQWAKAHGISDPNNCSGNTESFIEGCRVLAAEQQLTLAAE